MQPLEGRDVHAEPVEPEAEAEQRHDEGRAHDVPAVEVSSAHAWTLAAGRAGVSPFSDVIVPTAPRATGCVLGSLYREHHPRSRFTGMRSGADRARPPVRRVVL